MPPRLDQQLSSARKRAELEQLRLREKVLRSLRNGYDFADPNLQRKRRTLSSEVGKTEEDIFDKLKRDRGVTFCRDLYRNSAGAQAIVRQVVHNAVGTIGGKVSAQTGDTAWDQAATKYFNTWARDCNFRKRGRLNEFLRNAVRARFTDGDLAWAVSPDLTEGKIISWATDQLCEIKKDEWERNAVAAGYSETIDGKAEPLQQSEGVVYDSKGRVTHYIVSGKSSFGAVPWADASVISAKIAHLYGCFWREGQRRGVPELGLIAMELEDIKEMRSRELDTAKAAATLAFTVSRKDQSAIAEAIRAAGGDPESMLAQAESVLGDQAEGEPDASGEVKADTLARYRQFEELSGGATEYLDDGDQVDPVKIDRPNLAIGAFSEYVHKSAGAGIGLAGAFSSWSADKSYFAFQGDMILSWPTFEEMQKDLEYHICDPCWVAVISAAIERKELGPAPDGWEYAAAWAWPTMPQADKVKYWRSVGDAMRLGGMSFSDILGPDWQKKLDAAAEQADYAREKMPWLSLFETKAGAPLAEEEERDDEQN